MRGLTVLFLLVVSNLHRSECTSDESEGDRSREMKYYPLEELEHLMDVEKFGDISIHVGLLDAKNQKHHKSQEKSEQEPLVIYQIGVGEEDLPECSSKNEICSKVDLYGAPWVERQCRCPGGRACPSTPNADDGHTLADRTRQYKLCEAVRRIPYCRYFKDITWSLQPFGGPMNSTVQRVHCRCRPGGVSYLLRRDSHLNSEGVYVPIYYFGCSPQSKIKCQKKEPCKLFTVRKRSKTSVSVKDVNVSPLCQCQRGSRCPKKHTDPGSIPARAYAGMDIRTYSAYCVPSHHPETIFDFEEGDFGRMRKKRDRFK